MKQTLTQSMAWLHTWGGLIVGWLLFVIFLTGSLAVFDQEIDNWMQPELPAHHVSDEQAAERALDAFEETPLGQRFPTVVSAWRRAWGRVIPFFAFPPDVRRVIYTTNAIESVHARLRKIIKTRGHFPSDAAATKLIWLALRNITADWKRASPTWKSAMNQFAILYGDRFTLAPR